MTTTANTPAALQNALPKVAGPVRIQRVQAGTRTATGEAAPSIVTLRRTPWREDAEAGERAASADVADADVPWTVPRGTATAPVQQAVQQAAVDPTEAASALAVTPSVSARTRPQKMSQEGQDELVRQAANCEGVVLKKHTTFAGQVGALALLAAAPPSLRRSPP